MQIGPTPVTKGSRESFIGTILAAHAIVSIYRSLPISEYISTNPPQTITAFSNILHQLHFYQTTNSAQQQAVSKHNCQKSYRNLGIA